MPTAKQKVQLSRRLALVPLRTPSQDWGVEIDGATVALIMVSPADEVSMLLRCLLHVRLANLTVAIALTQLVYAS